METEKEKTIQRIQEHLAYVNKAELILDAIIKDGILPEDESLIEFVNYGLTKIWRKLYIIKKSVENDTISWDSENSES